MNTIEKTARTAEVSRKTAETDITISLNLDGTGVCNFNCRIGFLRHMLAAFCKHGLFDISGSLLGDLDVDQHHSVEDTGIVLGNAFEKALADKAGIMRSGFALFPMDETLCRAAVDFGGRPFLVCEAQLSGLPLSADGGQHNCAAFQTDTFDDFWQGFCVGAKCNLHLDVLRGRSDHHKMEGLFKAAARAMRNAVRIDGRAVGIIPSTKGLI